MQHNPSEQDLNFNAVPPSGHAPSVLIIDDDRVTRSLVQAILRKDGYQVLSAEDEQQALTLARRQLPDIILLDLNLKNLSGLDVCRRFKADAQLASAVILFLTAETRHDKKNLMFAAGAADYLPKPINHIELRTRINNHLLRRRHESQKQPLFSDGPGTSAPQLE